MIQILQCIAKGNSQKIMSFPQQVGDDFLDMLLSGKADEYLDREIQRLRLEIGENEFQEFAEQYFRNEGEENVYATKTDKKDKDKVEPENKLKQIAPIQKEKTESFLVTQLSSNNQDKYFQESPNEEGGEEVVEQGTTNNEEQGLTEVSRQNLADGNIKIVYNNGDYYEGEVEDTRKSGWGTYYYSNGEKYSGLFVDDQIHGYGRYYFLSGAQYEGDWSSGMKHGIGILKFANHDTYEGNFCKDDFHGQGTYRYSNGDVFEGKWKNGKKQGPGKFEGADGLLQIGSWSDDKFEI